MLLLVTPLFANPVAISGSLSFFGGGILQIVLAHDGIPPTPAPFLLPQLSAVHEHLELLPCQELPQSFEPPSVVTPAHIKAIHTSLFLDRLVLLWPSDMIVSQPLSRFWMKGVSPKFM
jgi:hypothetical protein